MVEFDVNWWAVIVGTVGYQLLGALWYGPLFGKVWMASMGYQSHEEMGGESPMAGYFVTALGSLLAAITLSVLVGWAEATTWDQGALVGAMVGAGIVGTVNLQAVPFEGRTSTVYLINVGYNLVALIGIGALVAAW